MAGVLITDGGPHPADKWAVATARQITGLIVIEASAPAGASIAKQELEVAVMKILHAAHNAVQSEERAHIAELGDERLSHPLDPGAAVDGATKAILAAAKGTMFGAHFEKPDVAAVVNAIVGKDFATSMDIERDWHAKGHKINSDGKASPRSGFDPNNEHVKRWNANRAA